MPIGISITSLYNLGPSRIKVVQQKGQHITKNLTRPHMIFFRLFGIEKRVSVVTCKEMRAFSMEGSFSKINKFILNQIMSSSSVGSRESYVDKLVALKSLALILSYTSP